MEIREYENMAKKICEEEFKRYKNWTIVGDQLARGYVFLAGEMEKGGIDLSSDQAKEIIRTYAFGFFMGLRDYTRRKI